MKPIGFSSDFGNNYTGFKFGFAEFVSSLGGDLYDTREFYTHPVYYKDMDETVIIHLTNEAIHNKFLRHATTYSEIKYYLYIDWSLDDMEQLPAPEYDTLLKIIKRAAGIFYTASNKGAVTQLNSSSLEIKYDYDYSFGNILKVPAKYKNSVLLLSGAKTPLNLIHFIEQNYQSYTKYFIKTQAQTEYLVRQITQVEWKYISSPHLVYTPKIIQQVEHTICDVGIVYDKYVQCAAFYNVPLHNITELSQSNDCPKGYTANDYEGIKEYLISRVKNDEKETEETKSKERRD